MNARTTSQAVTPAQILVYAGRIGADPADSAETALRKRLVVVLCVGTLPLTALWSVIYVLAGVPEAAALPAFYSVFTPINTAFFAWSRNLGLYRFSQLLMILVLPWLVTLALGGFGQSSMVIIWAALCPLGALLIEDIGRTLFWLLGFVTLLLATALPLPGSAIAGFVLVGLGLSNVVPAVFSEGGRAAATPAAGIAMTATAGYLGFLVGPPLIGLTATHLGLRTGIAFLAAAALLVALLALWRSGTARRVG